MSSPVCQQQGRRAPTFNRSERGAVLVVSLVFLLILTMLAVTNMREVALETRITGNLVDQKQLFNAAEAGLRDGEYRTIGSRRPIPGTYDLATAIRPLDAKSQCSTTLAPMKPCLINRKPTFAQYFKGSAEGEDDSNFRGVQIYSPDAATSFAESVTWYALPAPSGADSAESENPEYGNMALGIGTFRYEINARAESGSGEFQVRSTTSRIYY